jgi:hypothetical protein
MALHPLEPLSAAEIAQTVVSQQAAPAGSQPTLSLDEQIECEQAVNIAKTPDPRLNPGSGV